MAPWPKDAIADEKEAIDELSDKLAGLMKQKASLEEEISNLEDSLRGSVHAADPWEG